MPLQQILFKPKRGWVQYLRDGNGDPISEDVDGATNTFFELDGVVSEQHGSTVKLTQNPVEFGASITNHAIAQPLKITVSGVITNSPFVKQYGNQIPGAPKYSGNVVSNLTGTLTGERIRSAYAALVKMQRERYPFTLFTGLLRYDNMVLTGIKTPNDITNRLDLVMTFEEVILPNLDDSSKVGYRPTVTSTDADYLAAATSLATIAIDVASLAGFNLVGEIGDLQ